MNWEEGRTKCQGLDSEPPALISGLGPSISLLSGMAGSSSQYFLSSASTPVLLIVSFPLSVLFKIITPSKGLSIFLAIHRASGTLWIHCITRLYITYLFFYFLNLSSYFHKLLFPALFECIQLFFLTSRRNV